MQSEYRMGIYQLLAEAFKEPEEEWLSEQQAAAEYFQEAVNVLGYTARSGEMKWPLFADGEAALQAAYTRSFIFPVDSRIVPVESVFRQWTFDATAEVPFAKEKGYLMSDAALHMNALYQQYGLAFPPEFSSCPDHLCLELEFMAMLVEKGNMEHQRIFAAEHLNWLTELQQEAQTRNIPEYYRRLLAVTAAFIEQDCKAIAP